MNVLIVVDKYQSAIDRLAQSVMKYNTHLNIKVFPVHPKRNDIEVISEAQQMLMWADVIDIHYWKSGEVLRSTFPVEFEAKPKIVCHFNPYDYDKLNWMDYYDAVTVGNSTIAGFLPYAHNIPYCIDLDFWDWNPDYPKDKQVCMAVARIEGKKGVLEVAKACRDLKYKLVVAGRVSDVEHMRAVMEAGGEYIEFRENVTDEELRDIYKSSTVHVCNSVDNFESGTLPILEAMACGCPVLTRAVGHVPDLNDGKNMVVRQGSSEDIEDLKTQLKSMVENREWMLKVREAAWQTVKNRPAEKMARMYSSLYYQVYQKDRPLVSIIIPVFNKHEILIKSLAYAVTQTYPNIEVVVVDSGDEDIEGIIRKFRSEVKIPIKYLKFPHNGEYTLPKARNLGVLEAEGEILVFCDQRLAMNKDAVEIFVNNTARNTWLWGMKDNYRKGFVENFSSIRREDLISGGMFNERIDGYGGATQDIRSRFEGRLGYGFEPVDAQATAISKSSAGWRKKADIWKSKYKLWKLYS